MKIGISGQVLAEQYSLKETLEILKSYGVSYIEIWPGNLEALSEDICNDSYKNRNVSGAKELLEQYEIGVSAVSFSAAFVPEIAADNQEYAQELCRAVEVAYELGAKFVNHYCYYLSLDSLDLKKLEECMRPALDLAKEKNIVLVLENEAHDMTKQPEEMLEILKYFKDENFQMTFDATNYYQAGCEGFPEAYDVLKEYIGYIHIKNGCIYNADRHISRFKGQHMTGSLEGKDIYYTPVTEGAVNMQAVLQRAVLDGYEGVFILEPHCPVQDIHMFLEKDLDFMRNWDR